MIIFQFKCYIRGIQDIARKLTFMSSRSEQAIADVSASLERLSTALPATSCDHMVLRPNISEYVTNDDEIDLT